MKNFDVITSSPANLGKFLASLPVATGPWDAEFQKMYCAECGREDCDGKPCVQKDKRNNPLWWLMLDAEWEPEDNGMNRRFTEDEAARAIIDAAESQILASAKRDSEGKPGENQEDGKCMDFNVYLGRKDQGGTKLHGVEKVVFPEVRDNDILPAKAELKLIFRSMEYADAVIMALDRMCTIEIRTAVHNCDQAGKWEFHGNYYIFEAAPKEFVAEPLIRRGGTKVEVNFQVRRFTARDTDDKERWAIEWPGLEAKPGNAEKQE